MLLLLSLPWAPLPAQNVGIGTTNPQAQLDVEGKAQLDALQVNPGGASPGDVLEADANGNATWRDPSNLDDDWTRNSAELYEASGVERLGIGTTNPSNDAMVTIAAAGSNDGALRIQDEDGDAHSWLPYNNGNIYLTGDINKGDGTIIFRNYDENRGDTYQEKMRIATDGNVGINTTSPSEKLEVSGNMRLSNNGNEAYVESQGGYLGIRPNDSRHGLIMRDHTGNSNSWSGIRTETNGEMGLTTNGADNYEQLYLTDNDRVGVGTSDPSERLEVNGGLQVANGDINSGGDDIGLMRGVRSDDNSYEWVGYYSGSTRQGIILYDGQWGGANNRNDEFSITAENSNKLTLNTATDGEDIALMPDGSGQVGVKDLNPNTTLDVNGEARTQETHYASGYGYTSNISYQTGPGQGADYQTHEITCPDGQVMVFLGVIASDRLDGDSRCQCVDMPTLTTNHTWRNSNRGNSNDDDVTYYCDCGSGEVITGVSAYATSRWDYDLEIRCTDIAGASLSSSATSAFSYPYSNKENDDNLHWTRCYFGTYPTGLNIRASNYLDDNMRFDCAGLQPN
jgi:hypothetical protein